jgi:hypothetical protein
MRGSGNLLEGVKQAPPCVDLGEKRATNRADSGVSLEARQLLA